jgi:hypothetical protein
MKRINRIISAGAIFLALVLAPALSLAELSITLNNSFIEKYKNRTSIDTTFTVDQAHKKPNPPKKDGDLHIAGRAPEVGLPVVAEIMNAAFEKEAVDFIHNVEGTGKAIKMSGAWRIWCEHGGNSNQIQGEKLSPFTSSNPDHVFEIHPVTKIDGKDVLKSLKPIEGFKPKDAHDAFIRYENLKCTLTPDPQKKTTTIRTTMAGYNYVEFIMEIQGEQKEVEDGRLVMASVLDLDEELLVRNRRMVFVKDSPPEKAVRNLKKGDKLHVLRLPRVDLAVISWRINHYKDKKEVLTWRLPYEIIVVGVYK